jgi:DNA-binding transcriptional LysR family regulator
MDRRHPGRRPHPDRPHSSRAAGFDPRIVFSSDDYNAVWAFVAVGLGVAMLTRLALVLMRPGPARVALAEPPSPSRRCDESPPPA